MDNLIETFCQRCQLEVEPVLSPSGPHIKACCSICGEYIKFLRQIDLPSLSIVRAATWELAQKDQRLISSCKTLVNSFQKDYSGYWNLYRKVKQVVTNASA